MSHVLMVGPGAHGHVNPHLPVIAELVERGHRVSYAISDSFAEIVASAGATPLVHTSLLPDENRGEQWPSDPVEGMTIFLDEAIHVFPQLEEALREDRPDIVLYDIAGYPARALAHRWNLPLVQLSPAMVAWKGFEEDLAEEMAFRREPEYARYHKRFARWLAELGIDLDVDAFSGSPPRCVALVPRALQPHADRVDENVYTFVGPALDRRPHQGDWPVSDKPLLLISLGSAYTDRAEFYRTCVAAFGPLPWQVVIAIGAHVDASELGELPPNVELHRWVPQLAVLARAQAFVTHAGMGGCSEGLYQGVPMIAAPQAVDQFGNAAMLAEMGVGVHVDSDSTTPEELREALHSLVGSEEVAGRLAAQRDELRAAGGAAAAADVVEAEIANSQR